MIRAVKSLAFQGKVAEREKKEEGWRKERDMCLCVLGGVLVNPKIRNKHEIEDAIQMSPTLKPCAVYLGGFRHLSSVLQ